MLIDKVLYTHKNKSFHSSFNAVAQTSSPCAVGGSSCQPSKATTWGSELAASPARLGASLPPSALAAPSWEQLHPKAWAQNLAIHCERLESTPSWPHHCCHTLRHRSCFGLPLGFGLRRSLWLRCTLDDCLGLGLGSGLCLRLWLGCLLILSVLRGIGHHLCLILC